MSPRPRLIALPLAACFVVYLTVAGTGDALGLAIVWSLLALAAVSVIVSVRRARAEQRRRARRMFSSLDEYREVCDGGGPRG